MHKSTFSCRMLIVEDEPSLRKIGRTLLDAQGYEVLCAEDGFEGLADAQRVATG